KANPNVLECLYTPIVELSTPLADELIAGRAAFLSKLIYQTYNGYVMSQFKCLEQDVRTTGAPRWQHAMHLIRLLMAGITALREGTIPVRVEGEHRERLLAIKRGEIPWEEVDAWRLGLHQEFEQAFEATTLPDRPDYEWANRFLIKARRSAVTPEVEPLGLSSPAPELDHQPVHDDVLDLEDVAGNGAIATRLRGNVTIRERNAAAALEAMSR